MGIPTGITLYTSATPNGIKISILLEELGLEYKVSPPAVLPLRQDHRQGERRGADQQQTHAIDITTNEQKKDWFLAINPNGRIPALTDTWHDGSEVAIFESGAIMEYLVDRYDTEHRVSYPRDTKEHWQVSSWVMWQMGGLGPMQGQSNHFKRYAPEKIQYGIERYGNETRRLYSVMDAHLAKSPSGFLVGDRCTAADISCWGWVASYAWAGIKMDGYPALKAWLYKLLERPGFEKGRHVPKPHMAFKYAEMTDEELNERARAASAWVQQSQKLTK
ncbi:Disulfide-bond oxidoreductase YfcG [Escovopsis weberi]|uniref:Disulfide-bond oxidoreductase YfcG n=1 Tax=Escovopsis weberi TaxID=150374 RepID=A0A0M8MV03_ESCWE|nr:Disulfide-bond oxidoreductase YfcG [Escovopsis weberi]